MTNDLLILNAHVIDPATGLDQTSDIHIQKGRIAAIEPTGTLSKNEAAETIDATNLIAAPV